MKEGAIPIVCGVKVADTDASQTLNDENKTDPVLTEV